MYMWLYKSIYVYQYTCIYKEKGQMYMYIYVQMYTDVILYIYIICWEYDQREREISENYRDNQRCSVAAEHLTINRVRF